jgi:rSAM/selenodomain-associated transferase 1
MTGAHRVLDSQTPWAAADGLCALGVMTKAPRAGQVKTRLIPPLTAKEAAELNICFLQDTAAAINAAIAEGKAMAVAVYTPVGAEQTYHGILSDNFSLLPQRGEDFGERLLFAIEDLLRIGFESVCLINSDSPTVPASSFAEAVRVLLRPGDRMVLGPSDDGGYYLIGLKKLHRQIFEEIDWSTEKVLRQTMERAEELRLSVHMLPSCFDVDDRATLHRLCETLLSSTSNHGAPATQRFLRGLVTREGRERIWPNE